MGLDGFKTIRGRGRLPGGEAARFSATSGKGWKAVTSHSIPRCVTMVMILMLGPRDFCSLEARNKCVNARTLAIDPGPQRTSGEIGVESNDLPWSSRR